MAKTRDEFAEMRLRATDELVDRLADSRAELFNLRFQFATGQLDSSARLQRRPPRHRADARPFAARARDRRRRGP